MLIDPSLIVPRLRITIESLFQAANQAIYIGGNHRSSDHLTGCMVRRLHSCIDELGQIIKGLEPKKIDIGCLMLEEDLILSGYAEIKRGLVKSWEFIEGREKVIINQARTRIADQGRAGQ